MRHASGDVDAHHEFPALKERPMVTLNAGALEVK